MTEIKIERLRAALRGAEDRLKELITGIESNTWDEGALALRLRELEQRMRRLTAEAR